MPTSYLCIDDDNSNAPESMLNLIEKKCGAGISLRRVKPKDLASELDEISQQANNNKNSFGLILDLRLDRDPDEKNVRAPYRGSTLAQELRTRMTEGEIETFPIVLWTMDDLFRDSYRKDETSHDLFDKVYVKDKDITNWPDVVGQELLSLVDGYNLISEVLNKKEIEFNNLLGIDAEDYSNFDPRIIESFENLVSKHEYARFILDGLIHAEGMLIDEYVLAARLGVDIEKSKSDWDSIKESLNETKYTGAFCSAWYRWWGSKVESWWLGLADKQVSLKRLGAKDRVNILNNELKLRLVAAEPIDTRYSDRYWTICQILQKPLDSIDGFRASAPHLKPWQNPIYLSGRAVLDRKDIEKWRINPLELERLKALKISETEASNK